MINRNRLRQGLLSATILTGMSLSMPVMAQELAATDPTKAPEGGLTQSSNEIVVTATRRAVSLQDVPINISALSGDTLKSQRLDDITDIAAFTPGLTVIDNGPRTASNVVLRGITAGGTGGANVNSAVGVYLGEVPLYLDFKLLDITRVETLLGPQGTLYGRGTLSGAIRYIPNRPDLNDVQGEVHGRFYGVQHGGSSPGFQGDVMLNLPIISDAVAFRSVVGYYEDPGFIDYPFKVLQVGVSLPQPNFANPAAAQANLFRDKDQNDEQTFSTRNVLGIDLGPVRANLTYLYQRTKTAGRQANGAFGSKNAAGQCNYANCTGVLGTGKYEAPFRVNEPSDRRSQLFSAEIEADIGDIAQLVSATAYTKQKLFAQTDVTDLLLDLDYDYELFPSFAGPTTAKTDYKQFNQEVRLVSTHGGPFSWVLGGFYNKFDTYTFSNEAFPGLPEFLAANSTRLYGGAYTGLIRPDGLEYISFTDATTKEYAAFGEATFKITDQWQITGGGRYFKYKAKISGATDTPLLGGGRRRTPFPLVQFDPSRIRTGGTSDDGFVWKANTSYEFSDQLFAYATYSKGYRIGGVNRIAPCIQPLPPGQNVCALPNELSFGPDKTENKELGVRFNVLDRMLQGTVAIYHIKWSDVQVPSQTINGAVGITANAAAARTYGLEATFSARLGRFTLSGNYTYNKANLTANAPLLIDGKFNAFDGDRLPVSPKNAGALTGSYMVPLAEETNLNFLWTTQYRGNVYSTTGLRGSGESIPSYTVSRASITYAKPTWEVSLFANNIFDKYSVSGVGNSFRNVGINSGVTKRYYFYTVNQPRVFGVDFRKRFY